MKERRQPVPGHKPRMKECHSDNANGPPRCRTKTLEEEGREVLFATSSDGSPVNGAAEVKRLCNIAIAKYSDYCKALADIDDTSAASKGEEFTNLFINILYLVNQFRPVQGRQVLIDMLKRQAEERRSVAKKLNAAIESSQAAIDAAMVKSRTNVSKLTEQSDKRDLDGTTTTTATRDPVEEAVDQSSVNVFDI